MKLDLLYEIDAPKPWAGEHPAQKEGREDECGSQAKIQIAGA